MRPPRKTHPAFASDAPFEYPQHLRDAIDHLPQAAGIYVFHADPNPLPLYIGKSVNLRARVLSHLRNAEEARMLRQANRISFERTAGEIGALLLEARLIKQLQPLYNQKLRRTKQLCAWQLPAEGELVPGLVYSKDLDFAHSPRLFGLYGSRRAAQEALHSLADEHRLCLGLLGLEQRVAGRGCFRSMLQRCAGACYGREDRQDHDARLRAALDDIQVQCWPYPGAVGLIERAPDQVQVHAIHHWCYLGSAPTVKEAKGLVKQAPGFDSDGYKILCRPILSGRHEIVPLWE